jgi:hypothetical protein
VHVNRELSGNLAVRAAGLSQFERNRAALGNRLDLAASSAPGWALRRCGVAPGSSTVEPAERDYWESVVLASWFSSDSAGFVALARLAVDRAAHAATTYSAVATHDHALLDGL